jgi:hypothetical protein
LDLNEHCAQVVVEQIVVAASFRLVPALLAVLRRLHLGALADQIGIQGAYAIVPICLILAITQLRLLQASEVRACG